MGDAILSPEYWAQRFANEEKPPEEERRAYWDAKAPSFARKRTRSGYISRLIDRLALAPGETVLDMGCGSGTLAVPLAQAGHRVFAVDFSPAMLAELETAAQAAGADVAARIEPFQRSWQEPWDGLPTADVAISSRSPITTDLAASIAKLEAHARSRAVVTVVAGETPMLDARVLRAMGRDISQPALCEGMISVVNYLFAIGRRPRVDYLTYTRRWHAENRDDLLAMLREMAKPATDAEEIALETFIDEHAAFNDETGEFTLDYEQQNTWGYIEWDVPRVTSHTSARR